MGIFYVFLQRWCIIGYNVYYQVHGYRGLYSLSRSTLQTVVNIPVCMDKIKLKSKLIDITGNNVKF